MLAQNLDSFTLTFLMPHVSKADPGVNTECPQETQDKHSRKQSGGLVISAGDSVQWASHAPREKDWNIANG